MDFKERAAGVNGRRADAHGKPEYTADPKFDEVKKTGRDTEVKEGERE